MSRLSDEVKDHLSSLITNDYSINKICNELGLAKSTVYYYYSKIKGRKYQLVKLNPSYSEIEGEIVGIFAGDGSQYFDPTGYKYQVNVHFGSKNKAYAEYVKRLFDSYFGKKFILSYEKNEATMRLRTQSKVIFNFFKKYIVYDSKVKHATVKLHSLNLPRPFLIGFLRGLIDTDGSVLFKQRENRVRVSFCTTSQALYDQLKELFVEFRFDFSPYVRQFDYRKDLYVIQLKQASVEPFIALVKPFKASLL